MKIQLVSFNLSRFLLKEVNWSPGWKYDFSKGVGGRGVGAPFGNDRLVR